MTGLVLVLAVTGAWLRWAIRRERRHRVFAARRARYKARAPVNALRQMQGQAL